MIKNMNNEQYKSIKYYFIIGLFIFMILWHFISIISAVAFIFGIVVALINNYLLSYFIKKYLGENIFIILSYIVRIIIVASLSLLFISSKAYIFSYVAGLQFFYTILVISKVSWKGSD